MSDTKHPNCFDSPESQQRYFPYFITPSQMPKPYWFMLHHLMNRGGHIRDRELEPIDRWCLEAMTRSDLVILNKGWWSLTAYGHSIIQEVSK